MPMELKSAGLVVGLEAPSRTPSFAVGGIRRYDDKIGAAGRIIKSCKLCYSSVIIELVVTLE